MRLLTCVTTLSLAWVLVSQGAAPVATQHDDLDPVKADPAHHKVEFENAQVSVVRYKIAPGEITANHRNLSFVNIPLTDINAKFTTPDRKSTEVHLRAGTAAWRTPTTHVVQNIGDKPIEGIMVVPKTPSSALPAGAQDETIVDPKHSRVEFENDEVRVTRYHFDAGEKSTVHGHPDAVQIFLTDAKANVTTVDGKTTSVVGKAGEVRWQPATQHVVQNMGGKPLDGILVEMKGVRASSQRQ